MRLTHDSNHEEMDMTGRGLRGGGAVLVSIGGAVVVAALLAGCGAMGHPGDRTRTYFIAADEVKWDYAPSGKNLITGKAFGDVENVFLKQGDTRIGSVNLKAVFREYTDDSFEELKERPAEEEHLGILGPMIRAEVGDTVKVVFRNNLKGHKASLHPHGLKYTKDNEGAPYDDDTSGEDKDDDAVDPGDTFTYFWDVPESAGPGPEEGSSIGWMYHSHVDEVADVESGLIGPIVVTAAGKARKDGSPADVDREFTTLFMIFNENASFLLDDNIQRFAGKPGDVDKEDPDFVESNLKHSINGFLYGNLPGLEMTEGEKVRWYLFGMGSEEDLHTPHWHGQTSVSMGQRVDVVDLLPGSMLTADMVPQNPGTWLYHCHVNDHLEAGMQALYTIDPK